MAMDDAADDAREPQGSSLFNAAARGLLEDSELVKEGVDEKGVCRICRHLQGDIHIKTTPQAFIASSGRCSWCSVLFRILQSVTDVTKSAFRQVEIFCRGSFLPKGVVDVRLRQEGTWVPGTLRNKFEDPFPNSYKIYTPAGTDEAHSIPGLGLRDDANENYQELRDDIDDRLQLAKTWLSHCIAEHSGCEPSSNSWPKRVLEVSGETVYLKEFPSRPDGAQFTALSYCWGPDGNIKTLKDNINSHRSGLAVSKLPKTLQDAVRICRYFEVQYLWIDALCIVQDDRDDWTQQIPLMRDIYAGAYFVIAAESAATVHQGCLDLGVSKNAPYRRLELEHAFGTQPPRKLVISVQDEPMPHHVVHGHHSSRPDPKTELTPLSTRAWAFQERFLASRTLFFTSSEFSWSCATSTWCECSKRPSPAHLPMIDDYWGLGQLTTVTSSPSGRPERPLQKLGIWCEIVRQYSDRALTNWSDRIAAVQGVVVALSRAFPDCFKEEDFMFGLWRLFMARLLAWKRLTFVKSPPEESLRGSVPSWSWMGAAGPIEYSTVCYDEDSESLIDVLDIEFAPSKDGSIFGAGLGTVTLTGLLIPVRGEEPTRLTDLSRPEFHLPDTCVDPELLRFDHTIDLELDDPTDESVWATVTHFVPLIRTIDSDKDIQAMFLAPVHGQENTFRRVGYHVGNSRTAMIPNEVDAAPFIKTFKLI